MKSRNKPNDFINSRLLLGFIKTLFIITYINIKNNFKLCDDKYRHKYNIYLCFTNNLMMVPETKCNISFIINLLIKLFMRELKQIRYFLCVNKAKNKF